MIHLCNTTEDYKPCANLKPYWQDVQHDDARCPYHKYLDQNLEDVSVPKSRGRIISSSGRINEAADAERQEHEQCRNCETMGTDAASGCEMCTIVVVWYFSPIEECAGRVTVDKNGIMRRYAMDGVDEAVRKVTRPTICPRPLPPMRMPSGV
jgi:hypothetical protein